MIQRIQSVWLLLSGLSILLLSKLPIYTGTLGDGTRKLLITMERMHLMILALLLIILPIITIFLFKNRTGQKKMIWVHILLNILMLLLFYVAKDGFLDAYKAPEFVSSSYGLALVAPLLSLVLDIMAYIGISNDEKLIKAADKFR